MARFGYAGEILKVDLSGRKIEKLPTEDCADRFLGGRGVAAKIYWDEVPPGTGAYDPENVLVFITGPVAGFMRLAGCRWQVCGKSPIMDPETFSYGNLGGSWGAYLKYAGYDGLAFKGKSDRPVYLFIHDGEVEIRDASALWGKSTVEVFDALKAELGKGVKILAIGPAAENRVSFAIMMTEDNATAAGGLAGVMGSKMLKAIAVAGNKRPIAADKERLNTLTDRFVSIRKDTWKNWFPAIAGLTRLVACHGCAAGCFRGAYEAEGRDYKFFCQAADVYRRQPMKYYNGLNDVPLLATRLCDKYGLDTSVMQPMLEWLNGCRKAGVLDDAKTGMPLSKMGSSEFIETLTRQISFREGFGDLLADGTLKAAAKLGKRAQELTHWSVTNRSNETKDYDPRLILANAIPYATEPRRCVTQLHEVSHAFIHWLNRTKGMEDSFLSFEDLLTVARNFWGGEAAADYTTYEGKALAAKKIQDRTYAKESGILCDFLWPVIWVRFAADHTGDPTLESRVISAITGRKLDEPGLNTVGEKVFNLQRAIMLRDGWGGRKGDRLLDYFHDEPIQYTRFNRECIVPDRNGNKVTRQGKKIERADFEKLKDEYYQLRGWDVKTGFPTEAKLKELGLQDIAGDLKKRGLVG